MTIATGARLGPYEILSALGAGGMGEVYRARDMRLDRVVAIKVLPGHLAGNVELRQRVSIDGGPRTELVAKGNLRHPQASPDGKLVAYAFDYEYLGENEETFKWLGRAYDARSDSLVLYLTADPQMQGIRSDPRYKNLLKRMNLPE